MTLVVPFDAAAPPEDTWGPMLVVALVVVAVVAVIVGFGRITRGRRADGTSGAGHRSPPETTTSDDELPTDPG